MIARMKKISVIGMKTDRKAVMELLQKTSAVEFSPVKEIDDLQEIDVSERIMQFERYLVSTGQALEILDEKVPEKTGMFSVRKSAAMSDFSMKKDEAKEMSELVFKIQTADKKIHESNVEIGRLLGRISAISPWVSLDVPMNFGGTAKTVTALYYLQGEADEEMIGAALGEASADIYYEVISRDKDATRVFFQYLREDSEKAEKAIREAGFVPPTFSLSHLSPLEKIRQLEKVLDDLREEIRENEKFIQESAKRRGEIQMFYDHILMRRDKYTELEKLKQTDMTFVMEGYVPESDAATVKYKLEQAASVYVSITDIPDSEEVPVLLKNNGFARPVEGITKTYSMPGRTDVDPNGIMAFFYYLFFGMMFSDAGYGLLLALGAGYLGFFAKVERGTKENMRMFCYCGISTTFWGLMYGSFFGNLIPVLGDTFFGRVWTLKPLWLDPVQEPLTLLIVSVAMGLFQILIGLGIKFYMIWRQGEKLSAIFDVGLWMLVLGGICVFAGGMALKNDVVGNAGMYAAIAGAVGLVLTQGRNSKNIIGKLFGGILSLYDITSYVSDALSYSRLMALGLATGVIAQVVNTMGSLAGGGVVGAVMFVAVFIIGHALNFAINCLGAYVHTNRLQYVEFFGKFYEGGGRAFAPLKMDTKYYEFMEE